MLSCCAIYLSLSSSADRLGQCWNDRRAQRTRLANSTHDANQFCLALPRDQLQARFKILSGSDELKTQQRSIAGAYHRLVGQALVRWTCSVLLLGQSSILCRFGFIGIFIAFFIFRAIGWPRAACDSALGIQLGYLYDLHGLSNASSM